MVMGLVLESMRVHLRPEMFAQEFNSLLLVTFTPHSHPNQMDVVRHEAIGRAEEAFACRCVKHYFAKVRMRKASFSQPVPRLATGNVQ